MKMFQQRKLKTMWPLHSVLPKKTVKLSHAFKKRPKASWKIPRASGGCCRLYKCWESVSPKCVLGISFSLGFRALFPSISHGPPSFFAYCAVDEEAGPLSLDNTHFQPKCIFVAAAAFFTCWTCRLQLHFLLLGCCNFKPNVAACVKLCQGWLLDMSSPNTGPCGNGMMHLSKLDNSCWRLDFPGPFCTSI